MAIRSASLLTDRVNTLGCSAGWTSETALPPESESSPSGEDCTLAVSGLTGNVSA